MNHVNLSTFEGLLLLYFCADWCDSCREPVVSSETESISAEPKAAKVLVNIYARKKELAAKANCKDIEIVQLSADDSELQFLKFFSKKPWLGIPFSETARLKNLFDRFNVERIPHVAIVKVANGEVSVLNSNAVTDIIESDADFKGWPYIPAPITDLSKSLESYGFNINERPSIVLLMETSVSDTIKSHVYESLLPLAKLLSTDKLNDVEGPRILFFHAFEESVQSKKIRELCKLQEVAVEESFRPIVLILDFASGGAFYVKDLQREENEHIILERLRQATEKGSVKFSTREGEGDEVIN